VFKYERQVMSKRVETEGQGSKVDRLRRIEQVFRLRFPDGKRRTVEEMAAGLHDVLAEEEGLAAFEERMEEGRRYGRRWAATARGRELARVIKGHNAWRGSWWVWANQDPLELSPAERFFLLVRPHVSVTNALAWWARVLGQPDLVAYLEAGAHVLVAGFSEGVADWCSKNVSQAR
jgi:hypothetical protein